jgi:hypothetical protein
MTAPTNPIKNTIAASIPGNQNLSLSSLIPNTQTAQAAISKNKFASTITKAL